VKKEETLSQRLSRLTKKFAKSGLRLTDGSGKVKAVAFVGGVRKPENPLGDA
jgi:hypothetical protein